MDFNIDVRKKQLESLEQYINSSKDKVYSILDRLGWSAKKILEDNEPMINCTINPSHLVSFKTADEHLKKCNIKTAGYDMNEKFLSEPSVERHGRSSIKLDYQKKVEVLSHARWPNPQFKAAWNGTDSDPMTSDRLIATYSPDERLAIYNYCITNTEKPPDVPEYNILSDNKAEEGKELTYEEQLAKERDAKRRRVKHKSVHTNRKSHTEVIKEVIENQMELYKDWLNEKEQNNTNVVSKENSVDHSSTIVEEVERPNSSISKHSTHSAGSKKLDNHHEKNGHIYDRDYSNDRYRKYNNDFHKSRYDDRSVNGRRSRSRNRDRSDYRRRRSRSRDRRRDSRDRRDRHYRSDRNRR